MQAAGRFLVLMEACVERMHCWASDLAQRFDVHDRTPAFARMILGGYLSVSCGFAVDRRTHRGKSHDEDRAEPVATANAAGRRECSQDLMNFLPHLPRG